MSRARRLSYKLRMWVADLATRYEYAKARRPIQDDVADTLPDSDGGVHIRGSRMSGLEEPDEVVAPNVSRRDHFGRRATDMSTEHIITKKLVVITVVLVDALYLAGDALLNGTNVCP